MKAVFIDAKNQTVEDIEIENDLNAFYKKIGCEIVQVVPRRSSTDPEFIVCDEEACFKEIRCGFHFGSWCILGNALIVDIRKRGKTRRDCDADFTDAKRTAAEIRNEVRFFKRYDA